MLETWQQSAERLTEERDELLQLLARVEAAIRPTRQGKRDGGTFGRLSQVSDEIRIILHSFDVPAKKVQP